MLNRWRTWVVVVLMLSAAGGGAWYWLLIESGKPVQHYAIEMVAVRQLALGLPGDLPLAIRAQQMAVLGTPAVAVVAGDSFASVDLAVLAYQLVYPGGTTLIDTGLTRAQAGGGGMTVRSYDDAAAARVVAALHKASLIVVTHEHFDHIGALAADAQLPQLLRVVRLTKEQLQDASRMAPARIPAELLAHYAPLDYSRYHAIAPGVVLIKSPGHTPGSQMVFVRTNAGQEYLFTGDVAWHRRNIALVRERARLVTWLFLGEDRDAVLAQLAELHRLAVDEPRLHIVPGHDAAVIAALQSAHYMENGFR